MPFGESITKQRAAHKWMWFVNIYRSLNCFAHIHRPPNYVVNKNKKSTEIWSRLAGVFLQTYVCSTTATHTMCVFWETTLTTRIKKEGDGGRDRRRQRERERVSARRRKYINMNNSLECHRYNEIRVDVLRPLIILYIMCLMLIKETLWRTTRAYTHTYARVRTIKNRWE